jgi:hypothetical protein
MSFILSGISLAVVDRKLTREKVRRGAEHTMCLRVRVHGGLPRWFYPLEALCFGFIVGMVACPLWPLVLVCSPAVPEQHVTNKSLTVEFPLLAVVRALQKLTHHNRRMSINRTLEALMCVRARLLDVYGASSFPTTALSASCP